ncbi:uncharacterized protein BO97DRAFT_428855 [Aspergillus homomorphus CBS 101889]|uniref:Uncharacterized protein n=1 Tax=Aspergillus homomorphus (strain CBS 101889) TaxID=1450537 RepID=A0A395HM39_ASPHC|nr:hypothetical protein BO97DRAFT_428855 [Aspergillus homomorphus CBS 101889]RAL07928.1 hypothetical protein BO97DRAFT_428855 [Aspergillus homomorphus CBS 101889]
MADNEEANLNPKSQAKAEINHETHQSISHRAKPEVKPAAIPAEHKADHNTDSEAGRDDRHRLSELHPRDSLTTGVIYLGAAVSHPPAWRVQPAKLAILKPLAKPELRRYCTKAGAKNKRDDECTEIRCLGMIWRQELLKVPPISVLVFDLIVSIINDMIASKAEGKEKDIEQFDGGPAVFTSTFTGMPGKISYSGNSPNT